MSLDVRVKNNEKYLKKLINLRKVPISFLVTWIELDVVLRSRCGNINTIDLRV